MQSSRNDALTFLQNRFGIKEHDLEPLNIKLRNSDFWLMPEEVPEDLDPETSGIRALRVLDIGLKPTTYFLQILGDSVEKNRFEVNREELEMLLARKEMIEAEFEEEGYVAIVFEDDVIGCGFFRDGVVSSRIPKGRSNQLLETMD